MRKGADPAKAAAPNAVYLNASNYPLEWPRHVRWLDERPDVKPVFFIHDLLAVVSPELFWDREGPRHAARLELLARRGAAAIVASTTVEARLRDWIRRLGRSDLPILTARPPILPIFAAPCAADPALAHVTYFVVCGTIEPRKNHLLLIEVWKRLIAAQGPRTPKLVIVGKRGWRCDEIIAAIEDPAVRGHVIEAAGLSTAAYRALLGQARALLSPSFAEGFGLPVAEALTAGVPVVASDIEPHREQGSGAALLLDPTRADDWVAAIAALALDGPSRSDAVARLSTYRPVRTGDYLSALDAFLAGL